MHPGQNRMFAALPLAVTVASISGCGNTGADSPAAMTAATLGAQELQSTADYLSREPYVSANTRNGERLAAQCRACHTLTAGGTHRIGPALHGVFNRRAGSARGFAYSAALRDSEFYWTPRALDAWLAAPYEFLPGNRMSFSGISDATDRVHLVTYLLTETGAER